MWRQSLMFRIVRLSGALGYWSVFWEVAESQNWLPFLSTSIHEIWNIKILKTLKRTWFSKFQLSQHICEACGQFCRNSHFHNCEITDCVGKTKDFISNIFLNTCNWYVSLKVITGTAHPKHFNPPILPPKTNPNSLKSHKIIKNPSSKKITIIQNTKKFPKNPQTQPCFLLHQ